LVCTNASPSKKSSPSSNCFDADLFAVADHTERLEHDHRSIAADNAEKLVIRRRAWKGNFKTQHIAIELKGRRDVGDDKER
jgi:hypothetical protein